MSTANIEVTGESRLTFNKFVHGLLSLFPEKCNPKHLTSMSKTMLSGNSLIIGEADVTGLLTSEEYNAVKSKAQEDHALLIGTSMSLMDLLSLESGARLLTANGRVSQQNILALFFIKLIIFATNVYRLLDLLLRTIPLLTKILKF